MTADRPGKITFGHLVSLGSRLTDRDRQIALDCYDHHVLTTEQLVRLHFAGLRTATARLDALYKLRVLDRFRPPAKRGAGSTPYHWILDEAGAHIVAAHQGVERRRLRWRHSDALGVAHSGKLTHHVEINEFFTLLAPEAHAEHGALMEWYGERVTHQLFKGVAPDGYGVLALAVPTATRAKLAREAIADTGAPIEVAEWSKASTRSPLAIVTDAADQLAVHRAA